MIVPRPFSLPSRFFLCLLISLEPPRNPRWKGGFQPNRPLGTPRNPPKSRWNPPLEGGFMGQEPPFQRDFGGSSEISKTPKMKSAKTFDKWSSKKVKL
jgi:hypothetical protein